LLVKSGLLSQRDCTCMQIVAFLDIKLFLELLYSKLAFSKMWFFCNKLLLQRQDMT